MFLLQMISTLIAFFMTFLKLASVFRMACQMVCADFSMIYIVVHGFPSTEVPMTLPRLFGGPDLAVPWRILGSTF